MMDGWMYGCIRRLSAGEEMALLYSQAQMIRQWYVSRGLHSSRSSLTYVPLYIPTYIYTFVHEQKNWDLATGELLTTNQGHSDYIRCGTINPASQDVFISGSYDHKVCMA